MISGLFKRKVKSALIAGALLVAGNSYSQLGLSWSEMGPDDVAGRCRAMIIDNTDPTGNTMYAAGTSGGIFKSTDAANNWAPLNDQSASLIVSSMAQAPNGVIYVGTGETFARGGDGSGLTGFIGKGLYKFSPGATSITLVKDSALFGNINEVVVDPTSNNKIYVAGDRGLFVSTDAGATFALGNTTVSAMDVKVTPDGTVYYSEGTKTSSTSQVWKSVSGTVGTFSNITPTLTTNNGRIEIAVSPSNPNYVYISIAKKFTPSTLIGGGLYAFYASNDKGVTWKLIIYGTAQLDPLTSTTSSSSSFGDYCNTLVVDPTNPGSVYIAGYVIYNWRQISGAAFGTGGWTQIGTEFGAGIFPLFVHTKVHDIKFLPSNSKQYFIATDGGIYKTVSLTNDPYFWPTAFLPFNKGFNISQFNSVAYQNFPKNIAATGSPSLNPAAGVAGGTSGNGPCYLPGTLNTLQTSVGYTSVDSYQSDFSKLLPNALFVSNGYGSIQRSNDIANVPPSTFYDAPYKVGAAGGPGTTTFANEITPMRLWENYGNVAPPVDFAIVYDVPIKSTFVNTGKNTYSFAINSTRPQAAAKYDTVYITATSTKKEGMSNHPATYNYTVANTLPVGPTAVTANTVTSAVTFTVVNTRPNANIKYSSIVMTSTPIPTNIVAAQSVTFTPVYTGSVVTSVLTTATATDNAIFITATPSATPTDSMHFTFDIAPDNISLISFQFNYLPTQTQFVLATTRPSSICRYDTIAVKSTNPLQTFTILPKYDYNANVVSYAFLGTGGNTLAVGNNTVTPYASLTDSIRFTFNTAPLLSSLITVRTHLRYVQNITLVPTYSGSTVTAVAAIGSANTVSPINNFVYPLKSLTDSIRFYFKTKPDDSCTISSVVKLRYNSGDYVTVNNTDISNSFFKDSLLLTSTLTSNSIPPFVKIPLRKSARMAVGITAAVYVVKRPLNFAINPDWVKIAGKNSRPDSASGMPAKIYSNTPAVPILGAVTRLEWAVAGSELYFSTKVNDSTFYMYRTSHLNFIGDLSSADYSGIFSTDLDSVTLVRKSVPQRTTALGKFKYPITSISVLANNTGILVTTGGNYNKTSTVYSSIGDVRTANTNTVDNTTNFTDKTGTGLPKTPVYSSLYEMTNNTHVLVGTEQGIYSTLDITAPSPVWAQENVGASKLPNVPVFQIRQQTLPNWLSSNSGVIYVATHGRGLWSTDKYLAPYSIGVNEIQNNKAKFDSNIRLYPNPASDATTLWFNPLGDASYKITVYDLSGRLLFQESTVKLLEGEQLFTLNTTSLNSGVYFVNVTGTNNFNANAKFVISK